MEVFCKRLQVRLLFRLQLRVPQQRHQEGHHDVADGAICGLYVLGASFRLRVLMCVFAGIPWPRFLTTVLQHPRNRGRVSRLMAPREWASIQSSRAFEHPQSVWMLFITDCYRPRLSPWMLLVQVGELRFGAIFSLTF